MNDIERIPVEIKQKLESENLFNTLNVVLDETMVITADVAKNLAALTEKGGRVGAGLVIGQPKAYLPPPNVRASEFQVRIPMMLLENPSINREANNNGTLTTARGWAVLIFQVLHQWGVEGLLTNIYPDPENPWSESADFESKGYQALDLFMIGTVAMAAIPQCAMPTCEEVDLTVTLTGAVDETIYYTIDESFPGRANETAAVYEGPFVVEAGTKVRWAAYALAEGALKRGSDVGEALIS